MALQHRYGTTLTEAGLAGGQPTRAAENGLSFGKDGSELLQAFGAIGS